MKKRINWEKYPIKTSFSIQYCIVCGKNILYEQYYDGGRSKAHVECVKNLEKVKKN